MGVVELYLKYFELFGIDKYVMRLSKLQQGWTWQKVRGQRTNCGSRPKTWCAAPWTTADIPYVEAKMKPRSTVRRSTCRSGLPSGVSSRSPRTRWTLLFPSRFDLKFTNKEGHDEVPLCIHRAPLSTHERMVGFLLEHYAGNFPVWLSPEQVRVISITDEQNEYAENIAKELRENGIRASADLSSQRMNAKIRQAQLMKVPYMIVVGKNEMEAGQISLRVRRQPAE
jgi:threonyl-tRNA synthetase